MKVKYKVCKINSGSVTLYSDETTFIGYEFDSEQAALDALDEAGFYQDSSSKPVRSLPIGRYDEFEVKKSFTKD